MTEKKRKRRSPITSIIAILVCFSMLLGTTFAWFTDAVNSVDNIIQAGNLDVELYHTNAKVKTEEQVLTDTALFVDAEGKDIEWEPGVVAWENLTVKNVGTLALKYELGVLFKDLNSVTVDGKEHTLSEALSVAVIEGGIAGTNRDEVLTEVKNADPEAQWNSLKDFAYADVLDKQNDSKTYGVVIYWTPGDDDNIWNMNNGKQAEWLVKAEDYDLTEDNFLRINLGIKLEATQKMYEDDSFGNDYDHYAPLVKVINFEQDDNAQLTIAANEEATVEMNEFKLNNSLINRGTVVINGDNNAEINNDGVGFENFGKATVNDIAMNAGNSGSYASNTIGANAETIYNDVKIAAGGGGIGAADGAKVTFNSGNVYVDSSSQSGRYVFYAEDPGTEIIINGGEFGLNAKKQNRRAYIYAGENTTVIVNGGKFGETSTRSGYKAGIMGEGTVIITGGTFGFNPTKWLATGYEAVYDTENKTWTVEAGNVDVNEAVDEAIASGETTIILGNDSYIIPDSAKGKTLTFIGTGDTVIATQDDGSYEGCDYSLDGSTVTFENITINTDSSTYTGYARMNGTYKNCTINGTYTLYGNSEFNNCTFNVTGDVYNIWTWGAPTATFKNCTFNSDGKAMLLYGQANTKLTIDGCTFNDNGGLTDLKAAIEIGNDYGKSYELIVNDTTVNGYEINDKGINTGTTLWANKNSMGTDKLNVVVDGVDVY